MIISRIKGLFLSTFVPLTICLFALAVFPPISHADDQAEAQHYAPVKEKAYEGIPGRLRYNVHIVLIEEDKHGNIVPRKDSSSLTRHQLAATVMAAALYYAEAKNADVVGVTLESQPGPAFGKSPLATVTYAPDGKGVSGSDNWTWDMLQATPRGLTAQELKIQRLWGEMRGQFQANGFTDEERLKAAIAKKLKIPVEKVMLYPVFLEPFQPERTN